MRLVVVFLVAMCVLGCGKSERKAAVNSVQAAIPAATVQPADSKAEWNWPKELPAPKAERVPAPKKEDAPVGDHQLIPPPSWKQVPSPKAEHAPWGDRQPIPPPKKISGYDQERIPAPKKDQ
jgi:hypothetical protein